MKTGKSIVELATEIQRQAAAKKDYVVDTRALEMQAADRSGLADGLSLTFADQAVGIGQIAHDQIAEHTGVPSKYYRRMMAEAPHLLVSNVNWWMQQKPSKQLVRTLDGRARAFLSDKYRPMDNAELAEAVLPVLSDLGCEIMSAEITERRLYIKAIDGSVTREIKGRMGQGGHEIVQLRQLHPMVIIGNSEIGHGRLSIDYGNFDKFCTNGAIFAGAGMKKNHVGSRYGDFATTDQVYAMLTDGTRQLNDAALWATVRDVVRGSFDAARFDAMVQAINATQDQPLTGDIPKVVEVTAQRFGMNDGERKSVLDHLIKGGDLSRFGLYNAVTRTAEDLEDYDRATEFERMGGMIVELPATDWRLLAEAA